MTPSKRGPSRRALRDAAKGEPGGTGRRRAAFDHIQVGDRVEFETRWTAAPPRAEGTVISTWGSPLQLDIRCHWDGHVWVRRASDVIFVERPS